MGAPAHEAKTRARFRRRVRVLCTLSLLPPPALASPPDFSEAEELRLVCSIVEDGKTCGQKCESWRQLKVHHSTVHKMVYLHRMLVVSNQCPLCLNIFAPQALHHSTEKKAKLI